MTGQDKIKTTIAMDRAVWTDARLRAVAAGQSVGQYLEDLIRRTSNDTAGGQHCPS